MERLFNPFGRLIEKINSQKLHWVTIHYKVRKDGRFFLDFNVSVVGYVDDTCFFGCTVGRVTNRIKNAQFELDGKVYELEKNDGTKKHHLHGVFNKRVWESSTENGDTVVFKYQSPDGDYSSRDSRGEYTCRCLV